MSEPSSPVNGQNRVVEGLVTTAGAVGYRKGTNAEAVTGSAYNALDQVVTLGTTPIVGIVTEAAPATDTASSGLNGRLQRIAQRLTSLIALLPTALGAGGGLKVEGTIGNATDSGNVVKIGGVYRGSPSGALAGERKELWSGTEGGVVISTPIGGDGDAGSSALLHTADATSVSVGIAGHMFNGATWDRLRGNVDATLLASAARTATTSSADQTNYNGRGVHVVLDMTTVGTGSVTLTIQGKDALSGKYYTILAGVAVTTDSTNVYRVYPGLLAAANAVANDIVPRTWRVNVVANNANAATYSVGASNIL
uniref:Uncharacterized protein n=1 Tax=viral metagenome TaxID=1070528 RepID=A0A6M3L4E6_9ZZZZ